MTYTACSRIQFPIYIVVNSFFEVRLVTGSAEHTTKSNCIGKQTSFTICGRLNISVDIGYTSNYTYVSKYLIFYLLIILKCNHVVYFFYMSIYMNVNIIFSYIFQMNNIYI